MIIMLTMQFYASKSASVIQDLKKINKFEKNNFGINILATRYS